MLALVAPRPSPERPVPSSSSSSSWSFPLLIFVSFFGVFFDRSSFLFARSMTYLYPVYRTRRGRENTDIQLLSEAEVRQREGIIGMERRWWFIICFSEFLLEIWKIFSYENRFISNIPILEKERGGGGGGWVYYSVACNRIFEYQCNSSLNGIYIILLLPAMIFEVKFKQGI